MEGIEDHRVEYHLWLVDKRRSMKQLIQAWDFFMEMQVFSKHLVESKTIEEQDTKSK